MNGVVVLHLLCVTLSEVEQVRVPLVADCHHTGQGVRSVIVAQIKVIPNAEELSGSSPKSDVGATKVVHGGFGEHSIILELRLAQGGTIASDQDKLGYKKRS